MKGKIWCAPLLHQPVEDLYTRGLVWLADALSAVVCEECGAPALNSCSRVDCRLGVPIMEAFHFRLISRVVMATTTKPDDFYVVTPEKLAVLGAGEAFRRRQPAHVAGATLRSRSSIRSKRPPTQRIAGRDDRGLGRIDGLRYEWLGGDDHGRVAAMFRLADAYSARCDRQTGRPAV